MRRHALLAALGLLAAGILASATGEARSGPSPDEIIKSLIGVLDNLGEALTDQALVRYRFRIEGHTDTVGPHEYNKELSDRRAAAVVDYLANNFHVDRGRVEAVGMGEDRPLIPLPIRPPSLATAVCWWSTSGARSPAA